MESRSDPLRTVSREKWQWRSDSNPEPKTEESQWKSFSPEQNYLIQKAFYEKREEVDLGEYIIDIQDMIQRSRGNLTSQKPIRRMNCGEEEEEEINTRSERYFETELPKSINNIFGTLEHFISFFSRRNQEISNLTKQFQEFEQSKDLDGLNTNICPQLISCLEKELLQPIEGQLKDPLLSVTQNKDLLKRKRRHEELISLFKKDFISFEEFYGVTLKSYTMSTDLYVNLNKYLRNESWKAIDKLLLYAICLCKAFFILKSSANSTSPPEQNCSMILYRGTALGEEILSSYQIHKTPQLFSWNAVTSTSTNRIIAENFMYLSTDIENKKFPVMFIIEIPPPPPQTTTGLEYLRWLDIRQYSAQPKEDEVILPPGSAFELEQVCTDQDKRTTIKVKLKHDIESLAHGGLIMQGAFQMKMMSDRRIKIVCLRGKELPEYFKHLSGNRLIEDIEFCLCTFDNKSFEEMLFLLPTLEKAKKLKFVSCKYEDEQRIESPRLKDLRKCSILEVEIFEVQEIYKIFDMGMESCQYWTSLRKLSLDFRNLRTIEPKGANHFLSQGIKRLIQLASLTLDFSWGSQITDEGINALARALQYLSQLTSLTLRFCGQSELTDEGVKSLASQALEYLTQLTTLSLNFSFCNEITNKGVNHLSARGLRHLKNLTSMTLSFYSCREITDEGINILAYEALQYLDQLICLTLDFTRCYTITDKGIRNLAFQALQHLTQLTSFTLDLSRCFQITNTGVNILTYQELICLNKLTSLALDFRDCHHITDEAVNNLTSQRLNYMFQLSFLDLNFSWCNQISDEGVISLASQALPYLTKLNTLNLNFSQCHQMTDKGVNALSCQGLKCLKQLTSLTLDFSSCSQITDEGIKNLTSQALEYLTKLTSFILNNKVVLQTSHDDHQAKEEQGKNFPNFLMKFTRRKAKNKPNFCFDSQPKSAFLPDNFHFQRSSTPSEAPPQSEGLLRKFIFANNNPLPTMNDDKNFSFDLGITLIEILSQFSHSPSLVLSFTEDCHKITDQEMRNLSFNVLKFLTRLTCLSLDFSACKKITDEGVSSLASEALQNLTQLTTLSLNFSFCQEITDKGISKLACQGLFNLKELTSLSLKFSWCRQITDDGIYVLAFQALQNLTQLSSLTLDFSSRSEITDKGMNILASQGLKHLTQLTSLTLKFSWCSQITDEGVKSLMSQALQHLSQLISLTLDLSRCHQITDKGMEILASQGLQMLTQLTSLNLSFYCCGITDQGIYNLASQGLKYLTHLAFLDLDFSCSEITDEAVSYLASQGLGTLTQVTSLILNFSSCSKITDEGANRLIDHGIKYMIQLESLILDFSDCWILEFTILSIIRVLHYFGFILDKNSTSDEFSKQVKVPGGETGRS